MTAGCRPVPLPHPALSDPNSRFGAGFNRRHFFFRHGLSAHPQFTLDSLAALTRRVSGQPGTVYWSNGPVEVADGWQRGARQLPLRHTMARIERNDSMIILMQVQRDPVYASLLRDLLSTLILQCGRRVTDDIFSAQASILIASPGRITPYHFASEPHFLLQVLGEQDLSIFDAVDGSLVSEQVREAHHAGTENCVRYARSRQAEAGAYYQRPGRGVHIPAYAPQWARSRDSVSVAIRLSFRLRSVMRCGRVHCINHRLRNQGLRPTPPGVNRWIDRLKLTAHDTLDALQTLSAAMGAARPRMPAAGGHDDLMSPPLHKR
jgi:hypothetical protein